MKSFYPVTQLANNTKVVSHALPDRASVSLGVWVKVGSRYETTRINGISHFIEHLVFKGTQTRSAKKIKEEIEGRGGVLNAFTSEDTTCFLVKIVKDHFALALDVLTDMAQRPLFLGADIERERTVILEEIKMYMDMPAHYAHDLLHSLMWPDQSLGMLIAGTAKSVSGITKKDIEQYHTRHYTPRNTVVAVCGDIPHEEICHEVAHRYGSLRKGSTTSHDKAQVKQARARFHFCKKETEQTHLVLGMHAYSRTDMRRYTLTVLHIILGANMSSRLFEEVREKRGLAYEIRTGVSYYEDTGSFTVSAGVENKKLEHAIEVIVRELMKVARKGVTEGELNRAKEYLLNQLFFSLEDTMEHMLWLGDKAMYFDRVPTKEDIEKAIRSITRDDVQKVAEDIIRLKRFNLAVVGPIDEKRQEKIKKEFTG